MTRLGFLAHRAAGAVLALLLAGAALAEGDLYRFEMVIFERPGADNAEAWPESPGQPDMTQAVGSLAGLAVGGAALGPVAYTLKRKGMVIHEQIAWAQVPRGRNSEAWYAIDAGRLSGMIRVTRGRYLHVDTDLLLRDAGGAHPYRIQLSRRMRSDELHYIDHPKLGIVIRALRVEAPTPGGTETDSGEPRPVQPDGQAVSG